LLSQATLTGRNADPFSDQRWLRTVESFLPILKRQPNTSIFTATPAQGVQFQGDLYGLFLVKGIPENYFWIVMRMNDYNNPIDYDGAQLTFLVPDYAFIDEQVRLFKTLYRKNT